MAVLGAQLEQLVDVLGGLDVVEQVEVAQCQLGGHLGRVQLQLVDLTVLPTSHIAHHIHVTTQSCPRSRSAFGFTQY